MRSDLSNTYHGEADGYEVVDVHFSAGSVFSTDRCPWGEGMADFVMRAGYPKASEIKKYKHIQHREGGDTYRLYIVRESCPVLFFGGTSCPTCGGTHNDSLSL